MSKYFKWILMAGLVLSLSIFSSIFVYAGQWQEDEKGRWYQEDDGSYPTKTWKKIDGAYYYFEKDGYLMTSSTFGVRVGADGAWIPESAETNGKDNALTIVEDMGLTYGELKTKYGEEDPNCIQKFLRLENGGLWEYDDVNLSSNDLDFLQSLINHTLNEGAQYGKSILFMNSPIKFQETVLYNSGEVTRYIPNYSFLCDSEGNISNDSKPIRMNIAAKKLFPELTPLSSTEEMAKHAEDIGASNVEWDAGTYTFLNPWKGNTMDGHDYSKIKFELGNCTFEANNSFIDQIGLDTHIIIKSK